MSISYSEIVSRNIGIFTPEEQERLKRSTVAVAGMGGVGGMLVERLLRLGVGSVRFTDPGTFEASNLNRQFGSTVRTLDRGKAEVVYESVRDINPEAELYYDSKGIFSRADAEGLTEGADLVVDEMDYGAWKSSVYLQRAARKRGVYYVFSGAIGFGSILVSFDPKGITLEEYNKLPPDVDLESAEALTVPTESILPVFPSYATAAMSGEMLRDIVGLKRAVPTCSVGVGLTAMLTAFEAANLLIGRREPVKAPNYTYVDFFDQKFITGSI